MLSLIGFGATESTITGVTYSDSIIPGAEFSWKVARLEISQGAQWEIKSGYNVEKNDIIKLVITDDPDDLSLTSFWELFYTDVEWADAYLNDQSLGNDISKLELNFTTNNYFDAISFLIMPVTLNIDAVSEDTFDYFYDLMEPEQYNNDSGYLQVSKNDELLFLGWKYYDRYPLLFLPGFYTEEYIVESSYKMETGVLDKITVDSKLEISDSLMEFELTLLNSESTQRAIVGWIPYSIALAVIPVIIQTRRRRK